ncbi:MAG: cytochrome c-type biogenesis protein CcmH [Asticcacaulis sp.]
MSRKFWVLLAFLFGLTQVAAAVLPSETMSNPDQDARARALYREVRCVVCQNENIAGSSADIAADMRRDIRLHIREGLSDADIRQTLRDRYGDYVLFRPALNPATLALWFLPVVVLIIGGVIFMRLPRKGSDAGVAELSPEERARLAQLLEDQDNNRSS